MACQVSLKGLIIAATIYSLGLSQPRMLQFSSFIPAYLIDTPDTFNYGSFPYVNNLDPYIQVNSQETNILPQKQDSSPQYIGQRNQKQIFPSSMMGFGSSHSNINFQQQQTNTECIPPRINIGGICQCPHGQFYFVGKCIANNNNQIRCDSPRILINNQCICPNDGVFLSGQCYKRSRPQFPREQINPIQNYQGLEPLKAIFREHDGKKNNFFQQQWGSKYSPLERRSRANYYNGKNQPLPYLPNPRVISNQYIAIDLSITRSRNSVTMAFVIWGQFLDHDIDLTEAGKTQQMSIHIPSGDLFFKNQPQISFFRSKFVQRSPYTPREFENEVTAWIDGSQVYGSDQTTARFLRQFNNGKLRTSGDNLLPRVNDNQDRHDLFFAGDIRSNQNIMLTSFHTVFMREHNRVCQQILAKNKYLNDQQVYQAARNYVVGLLQKISIQDFLPIMLGIQYDRIVGKYSSYKTHINPNIPVQFSTAAFRIGHVLIMDTFHLVNKYGQNYKDLKLRNMFFHPQLINSQSIDDILRGLAINVMKQKGPSMVDQLRNLLVTDPQNRQIKLDLFSLNLQRSRDHGLPSYNQVRQAYGLKPVRSFYELVNDYKKAQILSRIYHDIHDVELFVGIISEQPVQGGVLGQLGCIIIGQTFRNLRDGDRYWYENVYPPHIINEIKQTSLSEIIQRNTNIRYLPEDIFHHFG